MNETPPMRASQRVVQVCLFLVAAIAMLGGTLQMFLGQPDTTPRLDNVHRFMAGVYFSTGVISFWAARTIRQQGTLVAQYGNAKNSFEFASPLRTPPSAWKFEFQHFPNLTASGSLLVSSHMPGCSRTEQPVANQHAFVEFDVDRTRKRLTETWRYTEGPEWPRAKGMAIRLANGNTLANYGTGGVIREITPDKTTAWHVKFDVPEGDDFFNKMVGHNELIDDLYALNGQPEP